VRGGREKIYDIEHLTKKNICRKSREFFVEKSKEEKLGVFQFVKCTVNRQKIGIFYRNN
jgi:hypothetical protein